MQLVGLSQVKSCFMMAEAVDLNMTEGQLLQLDSPSNFLVKYSAGTPASEPRHEQHRQGGELARM